MKATVIIPTTGSKDVKRAIESVLNQSIPTICYLVCDGEENYGKTKVISDEFGGNVLFKKSFLPINVGSDGFYGHRIYAAFSHLVNTEYVLYLDQDNWFNNNHVESCIETIKSQNLDWSYSLRNIYTKDHLFVCEDNCESLGKWKTFMNTHLIDTNCYCLKTEVAAKVASVWHGKWGQDRVFLHTMMQHFPRFDCTNNYTVNYSLGGNEGSVKKEFFIQGNKLMNDFYNGEFPWKKRKTYLSEHTQTITITS